MPERPDRDRTAGACRASRRRAHLGLTALVAACLVAVAGGTFAARSEAPERDESVEDRGGLLAREADGRLSPLPLLETRYALDVTGVVARGSVRQVYRNSTTRTIEAVYAFPLAPGAAVDDLELTIGSRRIVGVIREKAAARAEYEAAKSAGKKAALLERRCDGCFRVSVSGINAGEEVEVLVRWRQEARYDGGRFRIHVPLTDTPKYAVHDADATRRVPPPGAPTGAARAAGLVPGSGVGPRGADPSPIHAGARSALTARASFEVAIDAGVDLDVVESPTHEIELGFDGPRWVVRAAGERLLADREFIVEWTLVTGRHPVASVFLEDPDEEGVRHGLVTVVPPDDAFDAPSLDARTLFVIDVSGSMGGPSIRQAREALDAALSRLAPGDAFNVLAFNHEQTFLAREFLPADAAGLALGRSFASGLTAGGGTEIYAALRAAADAVAADRVPDGAVRRVVFLTDGAVHDRPDVLSALARELGDARLHVIGLGHAPNRPLLRRMSELGRGLSAFVAPGETTGNRIDTFFSRLDRPVLTDVRVALEGAGDAELLPDPLPDLHAGEPLVVSFRVAGDAVPVAARIEARGGEGAVGLRLPLVDVHEAEAGLGARWGARRVRALLDALALGADESDIRPRVVEIARRHRLVTPYTSFVAVEQVPTALEAPSRLDLALAAPAGSLPRGGTAGPLVGFLGTLLLAASALLFLFPWRGSHEPRP